MCSEEGPSCQSGMEGGSGHEGRAATGLKIDPEAAPGPAAGFLTAWGQRDTHAVFLSTGEKNPGRRAGKPYRRITWPEIVARAKTPTAVDKSKAQLVIPSFYAEYDGRTHKVQRERGRFGMLAVDVDRGNPSLDEIQDAVVAVVGPVEALIYSSSSASRDNRKWRVLLPLAAPLPGAEYADTQAALFDLLEAHGVACDWTLSRAAQPVYLPNVPPEKRDAQGRPLFYEMRHLTGSRPEPGWDTAIVQRREKIRAERERERAEKVARQEERQRQRLAHVQATGDDFEPITHFNTHHTVSEMFGRYGFEPHPRGSGRDWCSPLSESGSYSTQDRGDHWVSVSAWAHNHNVGRVTANGHRAGDAFDLYAHFEHGGDKRAAARAYAEAVRPKRHAEPPPRASSGRFTGQGPVAADPQPMPAFLDPTAVEVGLQDFFLSALEGAVEWHEDGRKGTPPTSVMKASPGSGKTSTALKSLRDFDLARLSGDVIFYMPTLRLAAEAAKEAEDLGVGWHVTRGRSAENPDTGEPMCARAALAEGAGKAGLSIKATLCERETEDGSIAQCPYHEICSGARVAETGEPNPGYLRQWRGLDGGPEVRFESHAYLQTNGDGSGRTIGLGIVDEKVWPSFLREGYLPLTDMENAGLRPPPRGRARRRASDYEARVAEAADRQAAGRAVVAALRAGTSPVLTRYTAEDFEAFSAAEDRRATILPPLPSAPDAELAEVIAAARQDRDTAGLRAMLWRMLAHAKRSGRDDIERLEVLPHWQGYTGKETPREALHLRWLATFPGKVPTILLDADAVPEVVERMHPGARIHTIDMAPNAEVIQVEDRTFSKQSLLAGKKLRADCVGVIRAEVVRDHRGQAGRRGVLVVTTKAVARRFFDDAGAIPCDISEAEAGSYMQSAELHGARWLWYGPGSLGLNAYSAFGTVIAIGREELPYDVLEGTARALFGDHGEPLKLLDRDADGRPLMPAVPVPYLMADGSGRAARVPVHPDPKVRALQGQTRECGLRQAVERLRLARATETKRVLLLTKVPLPGFPVTKLVSFEDLAPPRLIAALHEAGGILRLSAAGLSADAPQSFRTQKAAERWLSREGKEIVNAPTPLIVSYYRCGGINAVLASMRLVGQRGPKPTLVLIAVPGDPRMAVEAHYGALAEFHIQSEFTRRAACTVAPPTPVARSTDQKPERPTADIPATLPPPACSPDGEVASRTAPDASQAPPKAEEDGIGQSVAPAPWGARADISAPDGLEMPQPQEMPEIKPRSAAARVLAAVQAGNRTPGAVAMATKLGVSKTYLALQALLRAGLIHEGRDGTFSASNVQLLPRRAKSRGPDAPSPPDHVYVQRGAWMAVEKTFAQRNSAPSLHLVTSQTASRDVASEADMVLGKKLRVAFDEYSAMDVRSPDAW